MFGPRRKELTRQLGEAQERIRELEAWKAKTEDLFDRSYVQQMELAGEIMTSLRGGARISQKAFAMLQRMGLFEKEFQGAGGDLGRIDQQIGELSKSIITTSAAIDQTSAAIEQISASITMISQESSTRFHDIRNLAALSKSGQEEMAATLKVIQDVTAGIDDLRSFLEIIDDIAGKTSILSMNAAIQAAHAGEVGKGFAVVADEVRRLAESSSANAAAIAKRLNGLIETIHRAEASSRKTSGILTEAEDKVAKASAGFQEIQYGTQELAQGGREMLQGVSSLREVASVLTETGTVIAMNTSAITAKIGSLRSESMALESELTALRRESSELNGAGTTLTQSAVKQLSVSRDFQAQTGAMDPTFAAILSLQHLGWVTRVRGALDGTHPIDGSSLGDHHTCDLGRWLDGPGRSVLPADQYQAVTSRHEAMHGQVKRILGLIQSDGKRAEAEGEFPELVAHSEAIVGVLRTLAGQGADQAVLVRWKAEFEVGNRTIDDQHRRLVDLINKLFTALQSGQGRKVLEGVLQELVDYTLTHFRDEEALFQASPYPDKKSHLEEHKAFVETVSKFQRDFLAGKVVLGSETVHFLKDWLVKHIMGSDQGYARYLGKRHSPPNLGGEPQNRRT